MNRLMLRRVLLASAWLLAVATGCATRGTQVEPLGFLGDYAELERGRPGQASLIYIDSATDFSIYSGIVFDPVVPWAEPDGEPQESIRAMAMELEEDLRREFAEAFEVVPTPRAGAMRMRAALGAVGEIAPVGDATLILEVEVLDSESGRRIIAAVDEREIPAADRASATGAWATLIRNRLAAFRDFDAAAKVREAGADTETSP